MLKMLLIPLVYISFLTPAISQDRIAVKINELTIREYNPPRANQIQLTVSALVPQNYELWNWIKNGTTVYFYGMKTGPDTGREVSKVSKMSLCINKGKPFSLIDGKEGLAELSKLYDAEKEREDIKREAIELLKKLLEKDTEEYFYLTKQVIELLNELENTK